MRWTAAILVTLLALSPTATAFAADAARGGELAKRWCAVCHLVAPDQERVPTVAPPFGTIGKRPNFDVRALALSMLLPHPRMPDRGLARDEAEDIAAYIGTLR